MLHRRSIRSTLCYSFITMSSQSKSFSSQVPFLSSVRSMLEGRVRLSALAKLERSDYRPNAGIRGSADSAGVFVGCLPEMRVLDFYTRFSSFLSWMIL